MGQHRGQVKCLLENRGCIIYWKAVLGSMRLLLGRAQTHMGVSAPQGCKRWEDCRDPTPWAPSHVALGKPPGGSFLSRAGQRCLGNDHTQPHDADRHADNIQVVRDGGDTSCVGQAAPCFLHRHPEASSPKPGYRLGLGESRVFAGAAARGYLKSAFLGLSLTHQLLLSLPM